MLTIYCGCCDALPGHGPTNCPDCADITVRGMSVHPAAPYCPWDDGDDPEREKAPKRRRPSTERRWAVR